MKVSLISAIAITSATMCAPAYAEDGTVRNLWQSISCGNSLAGDFSLSAKQQMHGFGGNHTTCIALQYNGTGSANAQLTLFRNSLGKPDAFEHIQVDVRGNDKTLIMAKLCFRLNYGAGIPIAIPVPLSKWRKAGPAEGLWQRYALSTKDLDSSSFNINTMVLERITFTRSSGPTGENNRNLIGFTSIKEAGHTLQPADVDFSIIPCAQADECP